MAGGASPAPTVVISLQGPPSSTPRLFALSVTLCVTPLPWGEAKNAGKNILYFTYLSAIYLKAQSKDVPAALSAA